MSYGSCARLGAVLLSLFLLSWFVSGELGSARAPCADGRCEEVTIFFTGSLDGRLLPVTSAGATCDPKEDAACFGGIARRIEYLRREREKHAIRNATVFAVDLGGSAFGGPLNGHPEYSLGAPETELMNLVPYDFCTFSNRDFLGAMGKGAALEGDWIRSFVERTCPLLLSNVRFQGPWEALSPKLQPWAVRATAGGLKVGFVGMMPYSTDLGYGSHRPYFEIDQSSLIADIINGTFPGLRVNLDMLRNELNKYSGDFAKFDPQAADVTVLSTLVPVDVCIAAETAKREHPDVDLLVLLASSGDRVDQIEWLARNGPFDIILRERAQVGQPLFSILRNKMRQRDVIVAAAGDSTFLGFNRLTLQVSRGHGIADVDVAFNEPLNKSIASNVAAHAMMSTMYNVTRTRNTLPFGRIMNPLVGLHRKGEVPPSKNQCYYTECNIGHVLGRAYLAQARRLGFRADVSLSNLGAFRQVLSGTQGHPTFPNGTVFVQHCVDSLKFETSMGLFKVLGSDLYKGIKGMMTNWERGLIAAGMRIAFHEPCHRFVDHSIYTTSSDSRAPGSTAELAACMKDPGANVTDPRVVVIDIEVAQVDFDKCLGLDDCDVVGWRSLEMGTVYTIAMSKYVAGTLPGFIGIESAMPNEAQTLCEYIKADSPVDVPTWSEFHRRGQIQYNTPQAGWADGAKIVSVTTSKSALDGAPICPAGLHLPSGGAACMECPAGTRSTDKVTRDTCDLCPAGFFNAQPGQDACIPCRKGFFAGSAGAIACAPCPPGSFSDTGAMYCNRCQPGFTAPEQEASACLPCSVGTFTPNFAATSCTSCPAGQSTRHSAAKDVSACECTEGSYLPVASATTCAPCPPGMDCPAGSVAFASSELLGARPAARPGHMTLPRDPSETYLCEPVDACLGGYEEQCAEYHDDSYVACGRCVDGAYMTGGGICHPCDGSRSMRVVLFVGLVAAIVLVLPLVVNRDLLLQSSSSRDAAILFGTVVFALQVFGTFDGLNFTKVEPIGRIAEFCRGFTLDVKFLRLECMSHIEPADSYVFAQATPIATFLLLVGVVAIKKLVHRGISFWSESANTLGTMCQVVFIGLLFNCFRPLICYTHPSGKHASMRSYPSALCFESREHDMMVGTGIISCLLVPLPFIAVNLAAVLQYPKLISGGSGFDFLKATRFLFVRFRPSVFYYGLIHISRSLSLCMVPILLRDKPAVQLFAVVAIFSMFMTLQQTLRPWHSDFVNVVDGSLSAMMVLLALSGSSQDLSLAADDMNIICIVVVFMTGAVMLLPMLDAMFRSCRRTTVYGHFVCHHKADAAAQARLLKMSLDKISPRPTFIDSDHLQDLDLLFDIVKFRTGLVVVYLTAATLTRPWCVGEITSAHARNVRVVGIVTPSFVKPTPAELDSLADYVDFTGFNAVVYGLSMSRISAALFWFCSNTVDKYEVNMENDIDDRCRSIVDFLSKRSGGRYLRLGRLVSTRMHSGTIGKVSEKNGKKQRSRQSAVGSVLVSADPADDEAVAGAYIVLRLIAMQIFFSEGAHLKVLSEGDCQGSNLKDTIIESSGLIVILSVGTLRCLAQLRTICEGMTVREELDKLAVVTAASPSFRFLDEDALDKVLPSEYLTDPNKKLQVAKLFKLIACPLGLHDSSMVLSTHCDNIRTRIQTFAPKTLPPTPKLQASASVKSSKSADVKETDENANLALQASGTAAAETGSATGGNASSADAAPVVVAPQIPTELAFTPASATELALAAELEKARRQIEALLAELDATRRGGGEIISGGLEIRC